MKNNRCFREQFEIQSGKKLTVAARSFFNFADRSSFAQNQKLATKNQEFSRTNCRKFVYFVFIRG